MRRGDDELASQNTLALSEICAAGTTSLLTIGGTVIGGTGTAAKTIKAGQKISAAVCVGAKADTLEPGTVLAI